MGNRERRDCPERFRHREGALGNVTGLGLFHNVLLIIHCDDNHQLVDGKRTHLMERIHAQLQTTFQLSKLSPAELSILQMPPQYVPHENRLKV
jgi:hypothetical protein